MQTVEMDLPYPPSVNTYWRRVGRQMKISKQGREFRDRVCHIVQGLQIKPMTGPLAVSIMMFPPDNRVRDLDNIFKATLDALGQPGAGVYKDDSQIVRIVAEKMEPVAGGLLSVVVQEAK